MDQAYDNSGELMKTYRKTPNGMLKESNERRWGRGIELNIPFDKVNRFMATSNHGDSRLNM